MPFLYSPFDAHQQHIPTYTYFFLPVHRVCRLLRRLRWKLTVIFLYFVFFIFIFIFFPLLWIPAHRDKTGHNDGGVAGSGER